MDSPEARAGHAAMIERAWGLVGASHRRAFRAWRACAGDVYLLNPMSDPKFMVFRILPDAITIAMDEADVPKSARAETRGVIKMLHGIEADASRVPVWSEVCMGSGCGDEPADYGLECRAD